MTPDELRQRVDEIIAIGTEAPLGDDEAAHSEEDKLHQDLIRAFCPEWVQAEVARLSEADFARWCS